MEPHATVLPEPSPLSALQQRILRTLFWTLAMLGGLAALAALLLDHWMPGEAGPWMALGYGLLGLVALGALRLPPERAVRLLAPALMGVQGFVALLALRTGWGLQAPALLLFGMAICIIHVLCPPRLAWGSSALAMAVVVGLTVAERLGLVPTVQGIPPLGARTAMHLAAIATATLTGRGIAQLVQGQLAAAAAREQRFRTLLGIAANAYWETDPQLRLSQARWRRGDDFQTLPDKLGQVPWELADIRFAPGVAERLRDAMTARQPLRDVPCAWQPPAGAPRHYLFSGEPRHDAARRFIGYWGVSRDVTAERRALDTLAAAEARYRELFNHIPSPVTLHQGGRIVDANPAAARLLGYASVDAMRGHHLLDEHVLDTQREAVRARIAEIETLPPGQALAPIDISLRTCQGATVHVKTVGASAEYQGRPATLSLSADETDRRATNLALSRTQTLLAQVVAMSPDAITVTDLGTGRYVTVNESFTRLVGYGRDEAVGRTALELGIWHDLRDRQAVLQAIADDGVMLDRPVDFVGKSGAVVSLMVSGTQLEIEGERYLLLSSRDVSETARVRLEREAILANASVGIAFTRDRRFVLANAQFERIFGWSSGSLVGQPGRAVWASDEDYAALSAQVGPTLGRGEAVDIERQALRRDGSLFRLRLRAKAIDPSRPADIGTIWIAEDVTAARQAEQELASARDAAEAANRAKSDFLANTSHEIRTPLNALQGLARLARQPGLAPARLHQYLDQIGESADLLGLIISDVLDLAKIEAGKLLLEDSPFALRALLESLVESHAALAAARGLDFDAELDPALPVWVRGDALRLRQILANFLHNALKFTQQGGLRLVVRAQPGARLRFEVHDTGLGIDAATQARLFRPFTQADESTTRRHGGTGLGLSICHELATLMGGEVGLSSQPGEGSCFHAELPLPAVATPEPLPGDQPGGEERLRGARVLLVEDNSVNMMIGVALLEQWGVQVCQATDGAQALAAVAAEGAAGRRFDAVLMDVQMPGLSGYEVTEALRREHPPQALPVIALTAAALVSGRERALAAGMNDFLTKPIDPQRLHDALLRALRPASASASASAAVGENV